MQALVDLSRGKLAAALGLQLPGSIEAERRLWRAVTNYAVWGPWWQRSTSWLSTIDDSLVSRGASAVASIAPKNGGPANADDSSDGDGSDQAADS